MADVITEDSANVGDHEVSPNVPQLAAHPSLRPRALLAGDAQGPH